MIIYKKAKIIQKIKSKPLPFDFNEMLIDDTFKIPKKPYKILKAKIIHTKEKKNDNGNTFTKAK